MSKPSTDDQPETADRSYGTIRGRDSQSDAITEQLGRDILTAHERFTAAIARRLPTMTHEERERYFALLAPLVAKLEEIDKPLKQVLQESMAELLPIVMQAMSER